MIKSIQRIEQIRQQLDAEAKPCSQGPLGDCPACSAREAASENCRFLLARLNEMSDRWGIAHAALSRLVEAIDDLGEAQLETWLDNARAVVESQNTIAANEGWQAMICGYCNHIDGSHESWCDESKRLPLYTTADLEKAVQDARKEEQASCYRARFPDCVDNAHCRSRREYGDGECGCHHDSIGMAMRGEQPKFLQRLWTKTQLEDAITVAVKTEREVCAKIAEAAEPGELYHRETEQALARVAAAIRARSK